MSPRKRGSRIYWRTRGGVARAYLDARDFADVGGKLEALRAPGEHWATSDRDVAHQLAAERIAQLEAKRRGRAILGATKETTLAQVAALHLDAKAESGRYTPEWLGVTEGYLSRVLDVLGRDRDPQSVTVEDVRRLQAMPGLYGAIIGKALYDGAVKLSDLTALR